MYQGTSRIRNGGFYLIVGDGRLEVLGGKPALAEWYSGKVTAGGGRVFGMCHLLGPVRWERELDVEIEKGGVVTTTV